MKILGVKADDFTDEVWNGVAESYIRSAYLLSDDEEVSSDRWHDIPATTVLQGYGGFRLGSKITFHSKLQVDYYPNEMLGFRFDANADPSELKYAKDSHNVTPESIQADFDNRISQLLGSLGIAETIERPY